MPSELFNRPSVNVRLNDPTYDASLRDRTNHTGTQPASTIVDFAAAVEAAVDALLVAGANVTITPGVGTITISATGGSGLTLATTAPPDVAASSAVGVGTTAARADHAHGHGAQAGGSTHAVATGAANGFMASTDKTKLDGVAAGATANLSDVFLLNRANHGGTQSAGTITGLAAIATSGSASDLSAGSVPAARFGATTIPVGAVNASGTADSTTFLRGDGQWQAPPGGGGVSLTSTAPPDVAASSAVGVGTTAARGDHTHGHGAQAGGTTHAVATGAVNGFMASADKTKLDGVAAGATANSSDATLLNRANHTGTQAVGTITGLAAIATSGSASDLGAGSVPAARFGAGTVPVAAMNASGTPNSTTFLRGDGQWQTPAGGGGPTNMGRIIEHLHFQ